MSRGTLFAALLAVVIGGNSLGVAQGPDDWAIDQVQRAVRERMASREGERDVTVRFRSDARTESSSNTLRVRGTGSVLRSDGQVRPFSYEAVVDTRNSNVSDIHYDWRGDWDEPDTNRVTGFKFRTIERRQVSWT
jgi:hypothetical protein